MNKLFVLGCASILVSSAFADLKSDWQKTLDSYCTLMVKKDTKGMETLIRANFTKDFKFVRADKKTMIGLNQWIEQEVAQTNQAQKIKKMSIEINSVKMGKNTAEMATTIGFEGIMKLDPKGKPGTLAGHGKGSMTLVQQGGKWKISRIDEGKTSMTFNGQAIKM